MSTTNPRTRSPFYPPESLEDHVAWACHMDEMDFNSVWSTYVAEQLGHPNLAESLRTTAAALINLPVSPPPPRATLLAAHRGAPSWT